MDFPNMPIGRPGATPSTTFSNAVLAAATNPASPQTQASADAVDDDDAADAVDVTSITYGDAPLDEDPTPFVPECIVFATREDAPTTVELYSQACLRCDCLVGPQSVSTLFPGPLLQGSARKCHKAKGNPFCPDGDVVFAFVGPRGRKLNDLRHLRATHGAHSRIFLAAVGELSSSDLVDADIAWVMQQLES